MADQNAAQKISDVQVSTFDNRDKANALYLAVMTLEGTAGGFSPAERAKGKQVLTVLLEEYKAKVIQEINAAQNPDAAL